MLRDWIDDTIFRLLFTAAAPQGRFHPFFLHGGFLSSSALCWYFGVWLLWKMLLQAGKFLVKFLTPSSDIWLYKFFLTKKTTGTIVQDRVVVEFNFSYFLYKRNAHCVCIALDTTCVFSAIFVCVCVLSNTGRDMWKWQSINPNGYQSNWHEELDSFFNKNKKRGKDNPLNSPAQRNFLPFFSFSFHLLTRRIWIRFK
jgi:hypothetical protein